MIMIDSYQQQQPQALEQVNHIRKSIAEDAASLGRLTRLREAIVEAVAAEKADQDDWTIKRASQTALEKSSMYRCIQEAVTMGLLQDHFHHHHDQSRGSELEMDMGSSHSSSILVVDKDDKTRTDATTGAATTTRSMFLQRYEQRMEEDSSKNDIMERRISKNNNNHRLPLSRQRRKKTLGQRASELLDAHVRNLYEEKVQEGWWRRSRSSTTNLSESWHGERHPDNCHQERHLTRTNLLVRDQSFVQLRAEEQEGGGGMDHDSIASLDSMTTTTTSSMIMFSPPLPSPIVPRWRKRFCGMTKEKLKECVALQAATQALDRTWRLEYQTHQELIVRSGCRCVYCSDHPSPFQTQEYQRLRQSCNNNNGDSLWHWMKKNDDLLPLSLDNGSSSSVVLEKRPPSLETIYGHPVERLVNPQSIKDAMNQIITEAAITAWDRTLRLQKKGQQHVVKDRCKCCYCRTASPAQTRQYYQESLAIQEEARGKESPVADGKEVEEEEPAQDIIASSSLRELNLDEDEDNDTPFLSYSMRKLHLDEDLDEEQLLWEGLGLTINL